MLKPGILKSFTVFKNSYILLYACIMVLFFSFLRQTFQFLLALLLDSIYNVYSHNNFNDVFRLALYTKTKLEDCIAWSWISLLVSLL